MNMPGRLGSIALLVAICTVLAPPVRAGDVIVVDASGGGNHTRIQGAIDAASDGDTILVKSGTYPPFTIQNKDLVVVADSGQAVFVAGPVRVMNLSAARDVVLVGLEIAGPGWGSWWDDCALRLSADGGSVRVEDCLLLGHSCGVGYCDTSSGAKLEDDADVAFARCQIVGGSGGYASTGLYSGFSKIAAYDTGFQGGTSGDQVGDSYCDPPDGGHGAELWGLSAGFLFASGSAFVGGDGGIGGALPNTFCECGNDSGRGGTGLWSLGAYPVFLLGDSFAGGAGGAAPPCFSCCSWPGGYGGCCPGGPGSPIAAIGAVTYPGVGRHLGIPNPWREGSPVPVRVEGAPGDQVFLFTSLETTLRFVPGYRGVQLTRRPGPPLSLGTIGPSGVLTRRIPCPPLLEAERAETYYFQAAHLDPQGGWTLGSPVSLVVLDHEL